jgi:hypothetical protein
MALILPNTQKWLVAGEGERIPTSWLGDGGRYTGRLYPDDLGGAIAVGDVIPFLRLPLDSRIILLQAVMRLSGGFQVTGNLCLSYSTKDGDATGVVTDANFLITIAAVAHNPAGGNLCGTSTNLLITAPAAAVIQNNTRLMGGNSIRNVYYTLLEAGQAGRGSVLDGLKYCFISFRCTGASGVAMPANMWYQLDADILMPNMPRGYTVVD